MSEQPHLRKGDLVRVVDAKRREDLRWDRWIGRVAKDRTYGELMIVLEDRSQPRSGEHRRTILPLEGPNALIVELVSSPAESR